MLNMAGLGFAFSARDKGVARFFEGLQGSVDTVVGQLRGFALMGSKAMGAFGHGAEGVGGSLRAFTDNSNNLTNSLEAQGAAIGKQSRAMAVNMGLSGAAAKKFGAQVSSMAIGLNMDADMVGKSVYAWNWAMKEFQAVGLNSAADVAKFSEVTGVAADDFAKSLRRSREEFQLTDEQLKGITSSLVKLGQDSGDVSKQLQSMPDLIEQLGKATDSTGKKLKGADLAEFARQTISASAGFYNMFNDVDKAKAAASGLADAIISGRKDFGKLFTGAGSEFPQFLAALHKTGLRSEEVFGLMNQGPEGFMKGMAQLASSIKQSGGSVDHMLQMVKDHLGDAVGEEAADSIVEFFSKADDAALKAMATSRAASVDLGKLAKAGWSSGRTLAESFELAEQSFITRFRNIGRKEAVRFVNDTSVQFNLFSKQLQGIAAEGGPLGAIVEKFSLMHQIGVKALLPQTLRPIASVLGSIGGELVPILGMLGALGFRFSMLASPLALLAAPLAIVVLRIADLAMQGKKAGEIFEQLKFDVFDTLAKKLNNLASVFTDWARSFNFDNFFKTIVETLSGGAKGVDTSMLVAAFQTLFEGITTLFSRGMRSFKASGLGEVILNGLREGLLWVLEAPGKLMQAVNWQKVSDTVFGALGDALSGGAAASSFLGRIGAALAGRVSMLATVVLPPLLGGLQKLFGVAVAQLPTLLKSLGGAISGVGTLLSPLVSNLAATLTGMLVDLFKGDTIKTLLGGLFDGLQAASGAIEAIGKALLDGIMRGLIAEFPQQAGWITKSFQLLQSGFDIIMIGIRTTLRTIGGYVEGTWLLIKSGAMLAFNSLQANFLAVKGTIENIVGFAMSLFGNFQTFYEQMVLGFKTFLVSPMDGIKILLAAPWNLVKGVMGSTIEFAKNMLGTFTEFGDNMLKGFLGTLGDLWGGIKNTIGAQFVYIWDLAKGLWEWAQKVLGIFEGDSSPKAKITSAADAMKDMNAQLAAGASAATTNFKTIPDQVQTAAATMSDNFGATISTMATNSVDTMNTTLVPGMAATYDNILKEAPASFYKPFESAWEAWVKNLNQTFDDGIYKMLDTMALATDAIIGDAGGIRFEVEEMAKELNKLEDQRLRFAQAKAAEARDAKKEQERQAALSSEWKVLNSSINYPAWWGVYEKKFDKAMASLQGALSTRPKTEARHMRAGESMSRKLAEGRVK